MLVLGHWVAPRESGTSSQLQLCENGRSQRSCNPRSVCVCVYYTGYVHTALHQALGNGASSFIACLWPTLCIRFTIWARPRCRAVDHWLLSTSLLLFVRHSCAANHLWLAMDVPCVERSQLVPGHVHVQKHDHPPLFGRIWSRSTRRPRQSVASHWAATASSLGVGAPAQPSQR